MCWVNKQTLAGGDFPWVLGSTLETIHRFLAPTDFREYGICIRDLFVSEAYWPSHGVASLKRCFLDRHSGDFPLLCGVSHDKAEIRDGQVRETKILSKFLHGVDWSAIPAPASLSGAGAEHTYLSLSSRSRQRGYPSQCQHTATIDHG